MTSLETNYAEPGSFEYFNEDQQPSTHPMAIGSLICSIIICCPLVTIFGPLLGVIALISIGSNPARRGKGLALAGIVIGAVATGIWLWGMVWGYQTFLQPVMQGPVAVLRSAEAGSWQAARDGMIGPAARASDDEMDVFFGEINRRYGSFRSLAMAPDQTAEPVRTPDGTSRMAVDYIAVYDGGTGRLTVDWLFTDQGVIVMKVEGLSLRGPDDEILDFPPSRGVPGEGDEPLPLPGGAEQQDDDDGDRRE